MRGVLADTGPLYALIDPDDEYHLRSGRELARLADDGYELVVAFPIMVETYKLILRSLGIASAHRWIEEVERRTVLYNPASEDYRKASLAGFAGIRIKPSPSKTPCSRSSASGWKPPYGPSTTTSTSFALACGDSSNLPSTVCR